MLNIVVPMAGLGSRFAKAGYKDPKPFIDVLGRPMITRVINNLMPLGEHQFYFVCLKDHLTRFPLEKLLKGSCPSVKILPINSLTQGPACTVLEAKDFINNDEPLMVANCDQFIEGGINDYIENFEREEDIDGYIMTMKANDPKWSFIRYENDVVKEVREKEVISDEATVGIYNFKKGSDFVRAAEDMISRNIRVNNEFYVAPTYNFLIEQGKKIKFMNIGKRMWGLGVPSDLEAFKQNFNGKNIG